MEPYIISLKFLKIKFGKDVVILIKNSDIRQAKKNAKSYKIRSTDFMIFYV
jgi:hypothetical protein